MAPHPSRRRWERERLATPNLAIYCPLDANDGDTPIIDSARQRFVDLIDQTPGGAAAIDTRALEPGSPCILKIHNPVDRSWGCFPAEVKWSVPSPAEPHVHCSGFEFCGPLSTDQPPEAPADGRRRPAAEDYAFFSRIPILKRLYRGAVCPLLNALAHRRVPAGERLVSQGEAGDACFIIQSGTCAIIVERDGALHPVAVRRAGDIVGETALLTGEPRNAHVEAETDMDVWEISRSDFELIAASHPELRNFLTEIVAERFAASHLTATRQIGKYLITDIIGRGGYSIVYKGLHTTLNMPVAIKMLNHDMAMDEEFVRNFQKEAVTIAQFNHDNIIKVFDVESRYQTMFIVMERLEGSSLRQILRERGRLPVGSVVHYLRQIGAGLHYAHQRGIIHQDIKPGNVFVLPDDRVKILDFGLACPCGTENMMTGTPYYMAPEQVECLPVDERTDIYALGLTAFEMLAGHRPFPEDDAHASMELHVHQDIPDPADHIPDLPAALRGILRKACARDLDARYRHIADLLHELEPLARELGLSEKGRLQAKKRMATLFLVYEERHQLELNRLMEDFSRQVGALGIALKAAEFGDW